SPHPPPVIFVGLPFTVFALGRAVFLWFLFELSCLVLSSVLLLKVLAARVTTVALIVLFFVWLGWHPFERELFWGQLMILTLTLISGAWLALRSGRDTLGGCLLGAALALKLFGWPIVLFLIFKRKWRAVLSAALCFGFLNLAAALVIGFRDVVAYYTFVGPVVSKLYRATAGNFSLWSIGPRAFDATASDWYTPLANVPSLALPASLIIVGVVLVLVVKATIHSRSFDTAFCVLASISIVLNPIAWSHYLVLTAPALCLVAWRIRQGRFPRPSVIPGAAVIILALLVEYTLPAVASLTHSIGAQLVPFWIGVIAYLPLAFVLWLTYVTLVSERWADDSSPAT
ncbi:MAG TPA: glycosyltransferase family 87 protein, partial [Pyrinomonadaceae bacterium]